MRDFHHPGRSTVYAANGLCATSHPLAASIAVDILRRGGNAVDAAVAAAVALGLFEPQMTGIGGDCFALVAPPGEDRLIGLNASGRAPAGLAAEMLRAEGHASVPPDSAHAVTVPTAIAGFDMLMRDWGSMGLEAVLAPAIRYAEQGAPVAPRVASDWANSASRLKGAARAHYLLNGAAPLPGDMFRAPGQAEVLRLVARHGAKGFYEGPVAEDMVSSLRALGGAHTLDDFAAARADYVEPITGRYRGAEIAELPPNGQGATALLMAAMLERFDIAALDPAGAARAHLEAEAAKLAFDARNRFIGDPDAMARGLDPLLDPRKAEALAALIDPDRALADPAAAAGAAHRETVYLCVVDTDRMAVSLIYSVFHDFGSGLASDKYGVNFQNRGAGFTLMRDHPNELGPGKRPMHTIIPGMVKLPGGLWGPFGVMGGQYQPAGHVRLISNLLDFGMDPQQAVDAPRSFPEDGALMLERGYAERVAVELGAMGHDVRRREKALGGAQIALIDEARGVLIGASDPRKDGAAHGW